MHQAIPQVIDIVHGPHINALIASYRGFQADQLRNLPCFGDREGNKFLVIVTKFQPLSPDNIYLEGRIGFQDDILSLINQYGFDQLSPKEIKTTFTGYYDSVNIRGTITTR